MPQPVAIDRPPAMARRVQGWEGAALGPVDLLALFLGGRSEATREAYRGDLERWARWMGAPDVGAALGDLLAMGPGEAHAMGVAYRSAMIDAGLASATIARRLAALRSVLRLARQTGRIAWTLDIPAPRVRAYRDTRGPGLEGVRLLLRAAAEAGPPKGARDVALLRLLFDLGLRRAEVVGLDVADLERRGLWVRGKGQREPELRPLPRSTRAVVLDYLGAAGHTDGPLFRSLDPNAGGGRLRLSSLSRLVRELGDRVGIRATPHGLRHAAVTYLLDRTGGNVDRVRDFSRHSDVRTVMLYNDRRTNAAEELSDMLASVSA
jgi:integrase/recombinase XerC